MQLYNYVAGGTFPPGLPEGFDEWKFGRADVAIFVLEREDSHGIGSNLARSLQTSREFRGLVYSYTPENRDYLKCADFFLVPAFPSYIAVSHSTFVKYFNLDSPSRFQRLQFSSDDRLECIVINGDALSGAKNSNSVEQILDYARRFIGADLSACVGSFATVRRLPIVTLSAIRNETAPLFHSSEITVLFTRPAWRHTDIERVVYRAFSEFGAITDDVQVRILYPSHIAKDYEHLINKYGVVKLPAAVFRNSRTRRVVLKVERDLLQGIAQTEDRLSYLISDVHRAIASGRPGEAKNLVRQLEADTGLTLESKETGDSPEGQIVQIRVHSLVGDIVLGDKRQADFI